MRPICQDMQDVLASTAQTVVIRLTSVSRFATMLKRALLILVLPLVSIFLTGCGYNEIQRLDEQVKTTWSQTLNQYERRAELVPQLVNSVNAYMVNERAILTQVAEARSKVGTIQVTANDLDNPELMERFTAAQSQL